jgi:hypothetical protein
MPPKRAAAPEAGPPPRPPTLTAMAHVLSLSASAGADQTLDAAQRDLGDQPDLADPAQAARLHRWLNQWGCRIGYPGPGQPDVFVNSLAAWWPTSKDLLPHPRQRLAQLTDAQLDSARQAYAGVYLCPAAVSTAGRARAFGPTAAAKLLYFIRPLAITPWDNAISLRTGGGRDDAAFLRHLTACRGWAQDLEAEARGLGLAPDEIGAYLGRPASSVARLIDEWLYTTITAGLRADASS